MGDYSPSPFTFPNRLHNSHHLHNNLTERCPDCSQSPDLLKPIREPWINSDAANQPRDTFLGSTALGVLGALGDRRAHGPEGYNAAHSMCCQDRRCCSLLLFTSKARAHPAAHTKRLTLLLLQRNAQRQILSAAEEVIFQSKFLCPFPSPPVGTLRDPGADPLGIDGSPDAGLSQPVNLCLKLFQNLYKTCLEVCLEGQVSRDAI